MLSRRLSVGLALLVALAVALGVPATSTVQAQGPMGFGDSGTMGPGMMGSGMMAGMGMGRGMQGCGQGQQRVPASAISELPRVTVNVFDGSFDPRDITVAPGTVVVWQNAGSRPHSTTAWNRWDDILQPGESCAAWFVTPGTYDYLSIVAADGGTMTGSVTVAGPPIGSGMGMMPGMGTGMGPGTMPGMPMGPGGGSGSSTGRGY